MAKIRYSERGDRDEMYGAGFSSRIATVASRTTPKHIHVMLNNYITQQHHTQPHIWVRLYDRATEPG